MGQDSHSHVAPLATVQRLLSSVAAWFEDITKAGYVEKHKRCFLFYSPSSKVSVSFSQPSERLIFRGAKDSNVSRAGNVC